MMRQNKTKLNKTKYISKNIKYINQIRTTRTQVIQIKEEPWRKTHLAYGTQLVWYLINPSVPTQQDSMIIKVIKIFNSS